MHSEVEWIRELESAAKSAATVCDSVEMQVRCAAAHNVTPQLVFFLPNPHGRPSRSQLYFSDILQ